MRNLFSILLLTVMLRVWWPKTCDLCYDNGIFLSTIFSPREGTFYLIRTNDGQLFALEENKIIKSKWVEVKAEK